MSLDRRTPNLQLIENPSQTALNRCLDMFLLHHEASGNTMRTIETYRETLTPLTDHLSERDITNPELITPNDIEALLEACDC